MFVPDKDDCWIEDFDNWLRSQKSKTIPVDEDEFMPLLLEYVDEDDGSKKGIRYRKSRDIGLVNNKLVYIQFRSALNLTRFDSANVKEPVWDEIEEWLDGWKKGAPNDLKSVI